MSADDVLEALGSQERSSQKDDKENPYFFVEDCFLTEDIKVSVNNVGNLGFPLSEESIKKVLKQSFKAKFGKGEKTILDTTVRNTQMIPGEKLKVEIKEEVLSALLSRMAKDLNIDPNSRLIPHLYNMLIYERGHFFKEHKDSEKVNNMIATLVVLLPSPHEGGELIIKHQGKKCKFSGSVNHKIVKCVAFYSDCTHEVLKVTKGFRVALTYNIELHFSKDLGSVPVNPKLKKALSAYFADKKTGSNPKFIYYLNHLYSENSINWSMLKGTDRNDALALLAAAKELGYLPSLGLINYHKTIDRGPSGYGDDEVDSETYLTMLVDENNVKHKPREASISVGDDETCCSIETEDLIEPEESELEGYTGNEGQMQEYWYTRAAVVIFKSKWSYPIGFLTNLKSLHDLTRKPGNLKELKKKFDENSKQFLHAELLNKICGDAARRWPVEPSEETEIVDMLMDIALYLNDKKSAVKIICRFSTEETLKLVKIPKLMDCFDKILEPASWMEILPVWKAGDYRRMYESGKQIIKSMLKTYVSSYLKKHPNDYDVQVLEFLMSEIIDLLKCKESYSWSNEGSVTDKNFQGELKYILQILDLLKNESLEEDLSKKLRKKLLAQKVVKTSEHQNILQQLLTPKQFSRIAGVLLETMIDSSLNDIESYRESSTKKYLIDPNGANIKKFCSFFPNFMNIRDPQLRLKVLNRMESKTDIYTGILIVGVIVNLKDVNWNQNHDFLNRCLLIINKQLVSTECTAINWSLPFSNYCRCDFCSPVKTFLSSATSNKATFLLTAHKKEHVINSFKPSTSCPITFQAVKSGQKFNLIVEKSNKIASDYETFIRYLRAGKKKILQLMQSFPTGGDSNPPPCKVQKR